MKSIYFHPVHKGQLHTTSTTHQSRVAWKQQRLRARSFSAQALGEKPHGLGALIKMGDESSTNLSTLIYPLRQAALRRMSFAFSICACFMSFILPTKTDRDKLIYEIRGVLPWWILFCRNGIQGRFRKSTNWTVSIDLLCSPGHSLTRTQTIGTKMSRPAYSSNR